MISFSNILKIDLADNLDEDAQENLDFIVDAAHRMQRLVQDLLALSRSGRASMDRRRISLAACADAALAALETRMEETAATVIKDDDLPEVWGDQTMLTQLYQNLIGNALKFIRNGGPQVRLTFEKADGKRVFGVQDNGIGIKPEYGRQIFAPFKRLHGRTEYEGTGIGLAICHKMVERHGGEIWVESQPGTRSPFQVHPGGKER